MPTSVTMPALGESVTEGTVTRWLKQEGEQVEVDEPLLEVSTDKVDTEIPSPAAGVLSRILVADGLEPPGDGPLGDALAERRHGHRRPLAAALATSALGAVAGGGGGGGRLRLVRRTGTGVLDLLDGGLRGGVGVLR